MNQKQSSIRQQRLLIVIGGFLIIILLIGYIISTSKFRVVAITPGDRGKIATSSTTIKMVFNKQLKEDINYLERLNDPEELVSYFKIEGSTLYLYLDELFAGRQYAFSVNSIEAVNGEIINEHSFNFEAKYIPYHQLPSDQKILQLEETDKDNTEDPIAKHLPESSLHYTITGAYEASEDGNAIYVLNIKIILNNADLGPHKDTTIEQYKSDALTHIRSLGFNPDNYLIRYRITEPI